MSLFRSICLEMRDCCMSLDRGDLFGSRLRIGRAFQVIAQCYQHLVSYLASAQLHGTERGFQVERGKNQKCQSKQILIETRRLREQSK
jgi:hypothetical protein